MPATFPAARTTFIADHEGTNRLVVDFARNPEKFAINRYAQIVPMEKDQGYYLEMTVEEAGRVLSTDLADFVWPDGEPSPEFGWGTESHEFKPVVAQRYAYGFKLGQMAVENATWDVVAQHARIKAQQAMTARTVKALGVLLDTTKWPSGHVLDVTTIPGNSGNWAAATTANQNIRRSITTAVEKILDSTLGAVGDQDMVLVISSELAKQIALSQELVDYIKGSPEALAQIRGELPGRNTLHGLPDRLYGVEVVVEATRKTTTKKGATTVKTAAMGKDKALLLSRPGGLEGLYGTPSFSTLTIFTRRGYEMLTEYNRDDWHKRVMGRVTDYFEPVLTAPISGVLFTNTA